MIQMKIGLPHVYIALFDVVFMLRYFDVSLIKILNAM